MSRAAYLFGDLVVLDPAVDLEQSTTLWRGNRVRYIVVGGVVRYASEGAGTGLTGSQEFQRRLPASYKRGYASPTTKPA